MSAIQEEKGMREAAFCRVNYLLMFVVPGAKVFLYNNSSNRCILSGFGLWKRCIVYLFAKRWSGYLRWIAAGPSAPRFGKNCRRLPVVFDPVHNLFSTLDRADSIKASKWLTEPQFLFSNLSSTLRTCPSVVFKVCVLNSSPFRRELQHTFIHGCLPVDW